MGALVEGGRWLGVAVESRRLDRSVWVGEGAGWRRLRW